MRGWKENQIWSVAHLINDKGQLLKFGEVINKYNIVCTPEEYRNVVDNIPIAMINLIRNNLDQTPTPKLHKTIINNLNFTDKKCNNMVLRKLIIDEIYPGLSKRTYLFKRNFSKQEIRSIRTTFLKFPIPPKFKEIHFKIVNEIYP